MNFQYGEWNDWLHCRLAIGDVRIAHSVNGWHRGDLELIDAAVSLLGSSTSATARFQEEPGEFRWKIDRIAINRIRVRVFGFDDWDSAMPDESGLLLFDGLCGVVSFARAIHDGFCAWIEEMLVTGRKIDDEHVVALQKRIDMLRDRLRSLLPHLDRTS